MVFALFADIAKMAEKLINCMSARPTPPHTNPMGWRPKNIFWALKHV